ncbi:MAG: HesB/IscA family protein [Runella sp.]
MTNIKPVVITEQARQEILDTLRANKIPDEYGLRVGVKGGGCSAQFLLGFDTATAHDQIYDVSSIKVIIDKRHLMYVLGVEIGFEQSNEGVGFTVEKNKDQ